MPVKHAGDREVAEHPAIRIERRETRDRLWLLAKSVLSEKQHTVLWLRYGEDLEIKEIASVTGLSRTHVKVLLYRSRKVLGEHLSREELVEADPPRSIVPPVSGKTQCNRHTMMKTP